MDELIVAAIFLVFIVAAIFVRERLRVHDRRAIVCPRAKTVVAIRDGVCQVKGSPRVVGVAPACRRACLMSREADTRRGEGRERVGVS